MTWVLIWLLLYAFVIYNLMVQEPSGKMRNIHIKCDDGQSIEDSSEFVFHEVNDTIMIELFLGKGFLGERYICKDLDATESQKLREFFN